MLSAIEIMQKIGIDYMVEYDMTEILDEKGICMRLRYIHKKVSNLLLFYYRVPFYLYEYGKDLIN